MIIAFSSRGPGPEYELDESFGRAYYLLLYQQNGEYWTIHENNANRMSQQDAGVKTAQLVISEGADVVVTGEVGPRALRKLQEAGVGVYLASSGSVASVLEGWKKERLVRAVSPNSPGSPYCLLAQSLEGIHGLSNGVDRRITVEDGKRKGRMR